MAVRVDRGLEFASALGDHVLQELRRLVGLECARPGSHGRCELSNPRALGEEEDHDQRRDPCAHPQETRARGFLDPGANQERHAEKKEGHGPGQPRTRGLPVRLEAHPHVPDIALQSLEPLDEFLALALGIDGSMDRWIDGSIVRHDSLSVTAQRDSAVVKMALLVKL
jgi:hypothetical protein